MKLTKKQKDSLLAWISEGLQSDEINRRASKFKPPFEVSRQQVDHYRKTRGVQLEEIMETSELSALSTGLALREERVKKLQELAAKHEEDLFSDRLWLPRVKMIGSGMTAMPVDYEEYNKAEVEQYRGLLDDIAKEMGDRKQKVEHSGQIDVSKLSDQELLAIIES